MDILRQSSPTRENLSLLSVMEALEDRERITQRELAHATGLNLKKVNYCLHKLLKKGYVKFQRALYVLTPTGLKAKSQLTYGFLKFTLDFYNRMEAKLCRCLGEMAEAGVKQVVLYGASDVARILLDLADCKRPEIVGVVVEGDYDEPEFHGVPVIKNGHLHDVTWDAVLITTLEVVVEAEAQLHQLGVPEAAIWTLS